MCPLLYQILNKLDFHIKKSYQTPKYLLNKYEMTIKAKTSNNILKGIEPLIHYMAWKKYEKSMLMNFVLIPVFWTKNIRTLMCSTFFQQNWISKLHNTA